MQQDRSIIQVAARNKSSMILSFLIGSVIVLYMVLTLHPRYGAVSHVLLISGPGGRDPLSVGFDMPTIATSTSVMAAVKENLNLSEPVWDLQKSVTAHVAPKSSIMSIAFKSTDPAKAIAVPNAVADAFIKFYANLPQMQSRAVIESLGEAVSVERSKVLSLERRLEEASAGRSYVGSQASLDSVAHELDDLRSQRGLAVAQLESDKVDYHNNTVQSGNFSKIIRHEMLQNDPKYRELQAGVARDAGAVTLFRSGVSDRYPGIRGAEARIAAETKSLDATRTMSLKSPDAYSPSLGGTIAAAAKDRASLAGDSSRVRALDKQIAAEVAELNEAGTSRDSSLGALRAERDAAEGQLQALSLRFSSAQANAAESDSLGRAVVVDRAVKADRGLVGPTFLLTLGLIVVVAMSFVVAYLAELFRPRLISAADVETLYGSPTLASLGKH